MPFNDILLYDKKLIIFNFEYATITSINVIIIAQFLGSWFPNKSGESINSLNPLSLCLKLIC